MAAEGKARWGCTGTKGAAASAPSGASSLLPGSPQQLAKLRAETLPSPRPHLRPLSPTESTVRRGPLPGSSGKACLELPPPSSSPNFVHPWPSSQLSGCLSCQSGSWPWTLPPPSFRPHSHCPRLGPSIPGLDQGSGPGGGGGSCRLWPG